MIKVQDLFEVKYGVNLELLNCDEIKKKEGGIPFVSRTSKNNGIVAYVEPIDDIEPNEGNTISVAGSGSVLSCFYQKLPYYSGRDLYVLIPKKHLSEIQMLYYAFAIESNKYKYNYGRQANRTLKDIIIPDISEIPFDLKKLHVALPSNESVRKEKIILHTQSRKSFRYDEIFDIQKGYYNKKPEHYEQGTIPFIGATEYENGVTDYFTMEEIENTNKAEGGSYDPIEKKIFKGNCITVTNNGSVGRAFFQSEEFTCSHDVNPLYLLPKRNQALNKYIALFLITLIEQEQYRRNYGRKRRPARMPDSIIKLPVAPSGTPDRDYMENYIKSLPYSASL